LESEGYLDSRSTSTTSEHSGDLATTTSTPNQAKSSNITQTLDPSAESQSAEREEEARSTSTKDALVNEGVVKEEVVKDALTIGTSLETSKDRTSNLQEDEPGLEHITVDKTGRDDNLSPSLQEEIASSITDQEEKITPLALISYLPSLSLAIISEESLPELKFVKVSEEKESLPISYGLYAATHPRNSKTEAGLLVEKELGRNWSLEGGVGISRSSSDQKGSQEEFSNVRADMGFSVNDYTYTGITIPMRIVGRMKKNTLSAGLMLDRPISLDGLVVFE